MPPSRATRSAWTPLPIATEVRGFTQLQERLRLDVIKAMDTARAFPNPVTRRPVDSTESVNAVVSPNARESTSDAAPATAAGPDGYAGSSGETSGVHSALMARFTYAAGATTISRCFCLRLVISASAIDSDTSRKASTATGAGTARPDATVVRIPVQRDAVERPALVSSAQNRAIAIASGEAARAES